QRVGKPECGQHQPELRIRNLELRFDRGRQRGKHLPVKVIDGGGKHEYCQQEPSVAGRRRVARHWNSMVATSPAVASLGLGLGTNSTVTRRGFCTPHPSVACWLPTKTICPGLTINSLTIRCCGSSITRRA